MSLGEAEERWEREVEEAAAEEKRVWSEISSEIGMRDSAGGGEGKTCGAMKRKKMIGRERRREKGMMNCFEYIERGIEKP